MDVKRIYDQEMDCYFKTNQLKLGPWTSESMMHDPKHLAFVLSRYKFVAKMLEGRRKVLEVGCGDGFGTPIVAQAVGTLYAIDWEAKFINDNAKRISFAENIEFIHHDINTLPFTSDKVSAVFNIDFIEHLDPLNEVKVMNHMIASYENREEAVMIIGTPNLTAARYASPQSAALHINLKDYKSLKLLLKRYFDNVFMFGMNDEVLHTGYAPMCHYLWGVGVGLKELETGENQCSI